MPTIVPDRGNDPKRVPGSYMNLVNKAQVAKGDNPKWKCEACGTKGAQDYAGVGRICKGCADKGGY